ncbi:hypothetical protein [Edwardsiella tarda]
MEKIDGSWLCRKVIVMGSCEYEVAGIISLLKSANVRVCRGGIMIPGECDLLIVALSASPLLGWWRNLELLKNIRNAGEYRMVAIVPLDMMTIVSRQGVCPVVNGSDSLNRVQSMLLDCVLAWVDERVEVKRKNFIGSIDWLSSTQINAIEELLLPKTLVNKTQYSRRYSALARLGFGGVAHFRLVTAGAGRFGGRIFSPRLSI